MPRIVRPISPQLVFCWVSFVHRVRESRAAILGPVSSVGVLAFDEISKSFQILNNSCRDLTSVEIVSFRLQLKFMHHSDSVEAKRLKAHGAHGRSPSDRSPGDSGIGNIFEDFCIPLQYFTPHFRTPMQMALVYPPHFLDPAHELREVLTIGPKRVSKRWRSIDLDKSLERLRGQTHIRF